MSGFKQNKHSNKPCGLIVDIDRRRRQVKFSDPSIGLPTKPTKDPLISPSFSPQSVTTIHFDFRSLHFPFVLFVCRFQLIISLMGNQPRLAFVLSPQVFSGETLDEYHKFWSSL